MPNFCEIISSLSSFEELFNRSFIESVSIMPKVMFKYCIQAIDRYCRKFLDSNRIFRNSPKGFFMKMPLAPLEEKIHLPPVFIEHSNVFSADFKPVSNLGKGSLMLC